MSEITKSRAEAAKQYFLDGYNCAQAVSLAFSDLIPIEKETLIMLSSSFGGGMGRLREVCGAVSGAFIVLGAVSGYSSNNDNTAKAEHYKRIQDFAARFKAQNGSIICRELLGADGKNRSHIPEVRTEKYYKKRPCAELCGKAAEITEQILRETGVIF